MAQAVYSDRKFSKAWLVLAVVLVMFVAAFFLDQVVATLVPTYAGFTSLFGNFFGLGTQVAP